MVDVGGRKLHCRVFGGGSPVVVLLSGFRAPQEYWDPILPAIAEHTTVVTYDRAGYGKSEIGTKSCDGRQAMRELYTLLVSIGIAEPCLIIGHSLGGRMAQIFASLFPDKTAGLILLDTGYRDPRLPWRADGGRQAENAAGQDLEAPHGLRTEFEYNDLTWRQTEAITSLPRLPLTVVTAGRLQSPPWLSEAEKRKAMEVRKLDQEALTRMIPGGRHIILPDSGHNVVYDAMDDVIRVILDMIHSLRR
jgi:pimeloyl-ACP methyl ester carboxylesterase